LLIAVFCSWAGLAGWQAAVPASAVPAAPAPTLTTAVERKVTARASAWWSARERRDHVGMYALMDPAYRKRVTFADFVKESAVRTRFDLAAPRIASVVPEAADRMRVRVAMETRPPGLPAGRVEAEETWVRVSGQWWKVHEVVRSPFRTSAIVVSGKED
jgi:hypothetical protein